MQLTGYLRPPLLLFLALLDLNLATEVKWTPTDSSNDPAHTAPRSQRYWDENNIERPDYAKTDAEIMMERGIEGSGVLKFLGFLAVAASIGYFVVLPRIQFGAGHKLGFSGSGDLWTTSSSRSEAAARQARLSRFEQKQD